MIIGTHLLFYSTNPEADRAFFRDVLGFRWVDDGGGWLIFAAPPAEAAFHPSEGEFVQAHAGHRMMGAIVYLMCDDLKSTIQALEAKGVKATEIEEEPWGIRTSIPLPSGAEIGLYQPTHRTALGLSSE
jgi:catechol 2,3-dioxygenase-like lactoylglutathione lyase family enzyme